MITDAGAEDDDAVIEIELIPVTIDHVAKFDDDTTVAI